MDNSRQLGMESCGRLLWRFSMPAIIGMLATTVYNIADRIFIGRAVGFLGISAITVVMPLFIITLAFGLLIGVGATVTVSIKLGQNNRKEAEYVLANALLLSVAASVFISLLGIFYAEPLLRIFGASNRVLPYAKQFATVLLGGSIFLVTSHVLHGVIRAEGNPKLGMIVTICGAILNVILNPIFIFYFKLGIMGSALATVFSQYLTTIWMLTYFWGKKSVLKLKLRNFMPRINIIKQVFAMGLAPFFAQIASSLTAVVLNKSLGIYGGDTAIAAMGIIHTISMMIMMPVIGLSQGAQPIIGYNYGAKSYTRIKRVLSTAIITGTYISTIGFILLQLFQKQIFGIFSGNNKELLQLGCSGMRIWLMMLPLMGIHSVNYFEAIGNAKVAVLLSLSKQVIFQLPLLLILPHLYNLRGVWMAGAAADFLSILLIAIFLLRDLRRITKAEKLKRFAFQ